MTTTDRIPFREWVMKHARVSDDPRGDFITDLINDSRWDGNPKTQEELYSYLVLRGACSEALEAGEEVFYEYLLWCEEQQRRDSVNKV